MLHNTGNWIIAVVLAEIGWVGMVTGFSIVLYSRLNLLVRSRTVLRWTLIMIIMDAFLFHTPTIVFQFGVSNKPSHKKYLPYMAPMERIQVAAFSLQETIISGIYIYCTWQYLQNSFQKSTRRTIALLVSVQITVILADVIVIVLDYLEYFTLKAVLHSFFYAIKLQLEFVILNDIKAMASKGGLNPSNFAPVAFHFSSDHSRSDSRSLSTPADKPSGKKWWTSRLGLPPTPNSSTETKGSADDEKRSDATSPISLPDLSLSAFSYETERRRYSEVSREMTISPTDIEFITSSLDGRRGSVDVEGQYPGRY